ncbi:Leucine-rich repeat receptor-like protein kinase PEPR1 [Acorus calamus]|uniref:Leucine-rich repeat receptor-like protein kinase PEPR1 n=1 Tax=Acorus calamus TaxID=4465 RepID=A0AAV9FGC1_ACOCL|nr:Leucine-rich repeat receptor-like protein kinase PEPR1 [Acorus calamus]
MWSRLFSNPGGGVAGAVAKEGGSGRGWRGVADAVAEEGGESPSPSRSVVAAGRSRGRGVRWRQSPSPSDETAFMTRKSKESDVYSYGVVLLEMITRLKAVDPSFPENTDIVSWVNSNLNGGEGHCLDRIVDPGLIREFMGSRDMEEVAKVLSLALRCTAKEAGDRPSMRDVVKQLTDLKMRFSLQE